MAHIKYTIDYSPRNFFSIGCALHKVIFPGNSTILFQQEGTFFV